MTEQGCGTGCGTGCDNSRVVVPESKVVRLNSPFFGFSGVKEEVTWKRQCGCIRTSEKLKHILNSFPAPPPPSPAPACAVMENAFDKTCGYHALPGSDAEKAFMNTMGSYGSCGEKKIVGGSYRSWQVIAELVQLIQLSVTATALALYYLIYCYMQLVYYTLRTALYFHNADGPMKISIGVVTVTSLVVGFNLLLRMERLIGMS